MCLHAASIRVSFATNKAESRAALCDICKGERSRTQFNRQFLKSRAKCVKCPAKSQQFELQVDPQLPQLSSFTRCMMQYCCMSLIPPIRSVSYIFDRKFESFARERSRLLSRKVEILLQCDARSGQYLLFERDMPQSMPDLDLAWLERAFLGSQQQPPFWFKFVNLFLYLVNRRRAIEREKSDGAREH